MLSWFYKLFFMKVMMFNDLSSLVEPKTWKTSIVITLIYFENLWLKMANVKSLHQSLVTILMSSQNNLATLIMHHGQLGKKTLQVKGVNRKQCRYKLAKFTHLIMKDTQKWLSTHSCGFEYSSMCIFQIPSLKLGVRHTQRCHNFMFLEMAFKFHDKASSNSLTIFFSLLSLNTWSHPWWHVEGIIHHHLTMKAH